MVFWWQEPVALLVYEDQHFLKKLVSYWTPTQATMTKMTANGLSSYEVFVKLGTFQFTVRLKVSLFCKINAFSFPGFSILFIKDFVFWTQERAALLIPRCEALSQGPRARALKGLGPGGPGPLFFFKPILVPPCVLAGVLSYVQGQSLMWRGKVLCAGVKVLCEEARSYVKKQSLMWRSKVLCEEANFSSSGFLWHECSMAWALYGMSALWRERSLGSGKYSQG